MTPLGAIGRGIAAGIAGTIAMDALLYSRYRREGGAQPIGKWEFSTPHNWDKVSAPGQVGRRLAEGFTQAALPARRAPLVNNIVHWGYGTFWGAAFGIAAGSLNKPRAWFGIPFGAAVFLSDYVILPPSGLYKPITEYGAPTLWKDLSAHLVYGAATGLAFRLLAAI